MTNAVLPAIASIGHVVVGKGVADPLVDLGQGESAVGCAQNGHANHGRVAVRWLASFVFDGWHFVGFGNVDDLRFLHPNFFKRAVPE